MEEEVCYATMVFTNSDGPKLEVEEKTVYAEVNKNGNLTSPSSSTLSEKNAENPGHSERKMKEDISSMTCSATTGAETAKSSHSCRPATVCLGFLFSLLLVALTVMCVFYGIGVIKYNTLLVKYTNEAEARQQIQTDYEQLQRAKQQLQIEVTLLQKQKAQLNQTLNYITKFKTFPVDQYCKEGQCEPCQNGWTPYQSNCYYYFEKDSGWKTWEKSRRFCAKNGGNLAIINSIEEQEFINNHTKPYYDKYHGYWIGLSALGTNETWIWTDGTKLNGGYWLGQHMYYPEHCVLSMPSQNPSESWGPAQCSMLNRWICEAEALIWPD